MCAWDTHFQVSFTDRAYLEAMTFQQQKYIPSIQIRFLEYLPLKEPDIGEIADSRARKAQGKSVKSIGP